MTNWKELAPNLGLDFAGDESPAVSSPEGMEGSRDSHQIQIYRVDEYRRTARTKIVLTFSEQLSLGLSIRASASTRSQGHWLWAAFACLFFAGGIGGALAAWHPGPLAVCIGGALLIWGWLASKRSAARRLEKSIPSGDTQFDRCVFVKATNREGAQRCLENARAREFISKLAFGDRELTVTDQKITVDINRLIKTFEAFETELKHMTALAAEFSGSPQAR